MTTHYAAIDAREPHGEVYGVGISPRRALLDASTYGGRLSRVEAIRFNAGLTVVPCTAAAAKFVRTYGGGPSARLAVSLTGRSVALREEE